MLLFIDVPRIDIAVLVLGLILRKGHKYGRNSNPFKVCAHRLTADMKHRAVTRANLIKKYMEGWDTITRRQALYDGFS